jgi:hypothetical protein
MNARIRCSDLKVGDQLEDLHLGQIFPIRIIQIKKFQYKGIVFNLKVPNAYSDFCYFGVSLDDEQLTILEKLGEEWNMFG